jgi:hypothetical protein
MAQTDRMAERLPPSVRPRGRRAAVAGAFAVAMVLCFTGVALAWIHTVNGFTHGLLSSDGGGVGSGRPVATITNNGPDRFAQVRAGVYHHVNGCCGWNVQCDTNWQSTQSTSCTGPNGWGSAPCLKYAFTGANPNYLLGWHGMRGANC